MIDILIPTIEARADKFNALVERLGKLIGDKPIKVITMSDNGEMTTGAKRNALLGFAQSEYVCFIDDDDNVSDNYIELMYKAAQSGCDCASLVGLITFDGKNPRYFIHSLKYDHYHEGKEYYRPPNHLNLIKREIAVKFKFPDKYISEDTDWAMQLVRAGALKTEYPISETIYFYKYITKK